MTELLSYPVSAEAGLMVVVDAASVLSFSAACSS